MKKLPRSFYDRDGLIVAKDLLGKYLVHKVKGQELIGKIVEVEAYMGVEDKAAHSYGNKRTPRTEAMFGPPGHAYIYLIYGMYYCMNVVTNQPGIAQAVLIRGIEPVSNIEEMSQYRYHKSLQELTRSQRKNITNGPGKLCKAMHITKEDYGEDLCKDRLYICEEKDSLNFEICTSPRINIGYAEEAAEFPWRFYIKDNPYVS